MLTKYVILLMVVFWGSSEFSHPIFSSLDSMECYYNNLYNNCLHVYYNYLVLSNLVHFFLQKPLYCTLHSIFITDVIFYFFNTFSLQNTLLL